MYEPSRPTFFTVIPSSGVSHILLRITYHCPQHAVTFHSGSMWRLLIFTLISFPVNDKELRCVSEAMVSSMSLKTFLFMFVFMMIILPDGYIRLIPRSAAIRLTQSFFNSNYTKRRALRHKKLTSSTLNIHMKFQQQQTSISRGSFPYCRRRSSVNCIKFHISCSAAFAASLSNSTGFSR